jgi:hypothetical protein
MEKSWCSQLSQLARFLCLVLVVIKIRSFTSLTEIFCKFITFSSSFFSLKSFESSDLVCLGEGWNLELQVAPIFLECPQPKDLHHSLPLCLVRILMFSMWFTLFWWFICLFGHGSFHFVPCYPLFFGVLWLIYSCQRFIIFRSLKISRKRELLRLSKLCLSLLMVAIKYSRCKILRGVVVFFAIL